jgi:DNA-binding NarL/FixJ family response regulator
VLVADDQAAVRGDFAALVASHEEMDVVGEAADGREAVDLARRVFPNVVLMDVRMPVLDGLATTRIICSDPTLAATRVLVLTTFDLDEYVYEALRAGATGFLLKGAGADDLLRAIETVARGDALIAPSVTRRLIDEFVARPDPSGPPAALEALTGREREIMRLVARGLTNAEIAARVVISPLTAKTHVSHILGKLRCRDRAQLVTIAYESGLVSPGDADEKELSLHPFAMRSPSRHGSGTDARASRPYRGRMCCSICSSRAAASSARCRAPPSARGAQSRCRGSRGPSAPAAARRLAGRSPAAANARDVAWRSPPHGPASSTTRRSAPSSPPGRSEASAGSPRSPPRSSPRSCRRRPHN